MRENSTDECEVTCMKKSPCSKRKKRLRDLRWEDKLYRSSSRL